LIPLKYLQKKRKHLKYVERKEDKRNKIHLKERSFKLLKKNQLSLQQQPTSKHQDLEDGVGARG